MLWKMGTGAQMCAPVPIIILLACSCTRVVLIHELIKIPNYVRVFHNNEIHNKESTPTDISTLLTTLSSLGISISDDSLLFLLFRTH